MDNQNATQADNNGDQLVTLTASIVASYVGSANNHISPSDVAGLVSQVHSSLAGLSQPAQAEQIKQEPFVSARSSIKPDYIICLEDGKKLKMLKRYIKTQFDMTPDQYRAKWGLNSDYPMVAPNYAEQRRTLAKAIGLGTNRTRSTSGGRTRATDETVATKTPARRGRKPGSTNAPKTAAKAAPKPRGRPKATATA